MKLKFENEYKDQEVDVNLLRPNKSYDYLIKNRNGSLTDLIKNKKKLKKFLKPRSCPSCGSSNSKKTVFKDNLNIVTCTKCAMVYTSPIFDQKKYLEIYDSKEYKQIVKKIGEDSHIYRKKRFGLERFNILNQFLKKKKPHVLELGCSTGFFLEYAKENGWHTTGLELNSSAVNFALKRGLDVINEDFLKYKFQKKYDAFLAFDVIEHLVDPKKILKKAYNLLNKNGLVFVYVPNWNSASRLMIGEKDSHFIWPTHHLNYYTPKTLKNFFKKCKFELVHWETKGLDMIDYKWLLDSRKKSSKFLDNHLEEIQFFINSSGHGKNLRMIAKKI